MKICKTCKCWISFNPRKEIKSMESYDFKGDFKIGECKNKKLEYETYPTGIDRLCYGDSEEYSAYLITAEQFGCVHWPGSK